MTPILGKLGDQLGRRRVMIVSLSFFLAGAVGASLATTIWTLIVARIVMGVGGGTISLCFAITRDVAPSQRVGTAFGLVAAMIAVGTTFGVVIGGLVVDYLGWRFVFVLGAVTIATTLVLVLYLVPESATATGGRLDVAGALLLSAALASLLLGLTEGDGWGWGSSATVAVFALACVLFLVWGVVELRADEPMVDLRLLSGRELMLTNTLGLLIGSVMYASTVMIPAFVETGTRLYGPAARFLGYGFDATVAVGGLYLAAGSIFGALLAPFAGAIGLRHSPKWPLAFAMSGFAAAMIGFAVWHDEWWQVLIVSTVCGMAPALTAGSLAKLVVDATPVSETGVTLGINQVIRSVGAVIGTQLLAAVLSSDTVGRAAIPTESAYVTGSLILAACAAAAAVVCVFVTSGARSRVVRSSAPEPI
jgi:MFS family permease